MNALLLFFFDESPMELDDKDQVKPYKQSWFISFFSREKTNESEPLLN